MSVFAFLQKLRKLLLLVGDSVSGSRLVFSAGKSGGLLGQLSDIVADDRDALVKFFKRRIGHQIASAKSDNCWRAGSPNWSTRRVG